MNENLFIGERIEDICQEISSDEVDAAITNLPDKNLTLHEEVKKFKREQEIQSIRLCEVMKQKDKEKEEIEEKENENEIHQLYLQQVDFIDQINDTNQELINLRTENERFKNDLNIEK